MKFKKMPFEAFDASCTSLLSWSNIRVPDSSAKLSIGHVLGSHYEMDATYRYLMKITKRWRSSINMAGPV